MNHSVEEIKISILSTVGSGSQSLFHYEIIECFLGILLETIRVACTCV